MASSHEVKVLKKALELACIQLHGDCPHADPSKCCDIVYMTESYMRQAEEALGREDKIVTENLIHNLDNVSY